MLSMEWQDHLSSPDTVVLLDTNAFKYQFDPNPYKIVITSSIIAELGRHPDVFPDHAVFEMGLLLDPDIVVPFVSPEDEYLIIEASMRVSKRKNTAEHLGWVDMEQIAYALERARNGRNTALISNDGDILETVKYLRKSTPEMREHTRAISVQRYLERIHWGRLKGLESPYQMAIKREIESRYLAA